MSEREGPQPLARGGRGRHFDAEAQLASHRLFTQHLKIGEAVTIRKLDASPITKSSIGMPPTLLNRERLQVADHTEPGSEIEYESQPRERRGLLRGGSKLDAAEARWDLSPDRRSFLGTGNVFDNTSLPRLERIFYASLTRGALAMPRSPVDLG